MSATNPNVNPSAIILTPQQVVFNGIDVGGTVDSVTVSIKYDIADILADQFGKTKLDGVVAGQHYEVKFTLAQTKFATNWKVAFPSASLVGAGADMYFQMNIGDKLSTHAALLTLHPLSAAPGDMTTDLNFYKAVAMNASEVKYGPDKQTGLQVTMMVLPDTSVSPSRFMLYGDPAQGLINASAGSATPGMSNVGNGTITSIGVSNQYTKTETITVQCVGQTMGNNFYVSGSLSGAIGDFSVGAASGSLFHFVANQIQFTLTQGTVQFAYGDTFTIPTSGANYV